MDRTVGESLDVTVGGVAVLQDAGVAVAAQVAARLCGVRVRRMTLLVRAAHLGGRTVRVGSCTWGPVAVSRAG